MISTNNHHVSNFGNLRIDWLSNQHSITTQPKPSLINILKSFNEMISILQSFRNSHQIFLMKQSSLKFYNPKHLFFLENFPKHINQKF
jgi:hypothetical protein